MCVAKETIFFLQISAAQNEMNGNERSRTKNQNKTMENTDIASRNIVHNDGVGLLSIISVRASLHVMY